MYEAFYGLREKPFNLTPDPRFLYLSEKHKEAFAHLLFGIKDRTGFIMVSGEIGTGKTTICRTLVGRLGDETEVAFVFNPSLSSLELLRKINEEFGIHTRADSIKGLIDELNAFLLDRHARGKNCVLIIDEAQDLDPKVLEQIRLLSNLETETQKLLQIVLVGQPELIELLALPELRQLNQRITARYHLRELDKQETVQYIAYRLRVAGGRGRIRFAPRAVNEIFRASSGTPRVINSICDRALLIGYTYESRDISPAIVKRAVREIRGEPARRAETAQIKRYLPNPTLLALAVLILIGGNFTAQRLIRTWRETGSNRGDPAHPSGPPSGSTDPHKVDAVARDDDEGLFFSAVSPKTVLEKTLDELDPVVSRNAAAMALLAAWETPLTGDYPGDDQVQSLQGFAAANGLQGVYLGRAQPEHLAVIDLPAFVLMTGDEQKLWVGLVGLNQETATITSKMGKTVEVPRDAFHKRFLNQAVVLWRDASPDAPLLRVGDRGAHVRRLQEQLRAAGRTEIEASGKYTSATAEAVKWLQQAAGIDSDGLAGSQTRMALCRWLPQRPTPSLTSAGIVSPSGSADETVADDGGSARVGSRPSSVAEELVAGPPAPESSSLTTENPESSSLADPPVLPNEVAVLNAETEAEAGTPPSEGVEAPPPTDSAETQGSVPGPAEAREEKLRESPDEGTQDETGTDSTGTAADDSEVRTLTPPAVTGVPLVPHRTQEEEATEDNST